MNFLKHFEKLTPSQKLELIEELKSSLTQSPISIRQSITTTTEITKCTNCESTNIVKFGSYNGKRRFKCKTCQKTFSELTGTSICYIKKTDKWVRFIELMLEGKTIREISKTLVLSTKTVFDWRHKVLSSFEETFTKKFKGIVEMDDVYLPLNQKGRKRNFVKLGKQKRGISNQQVSTMIICDRYKTLDMRVVKLGRISKKDLQRVIDVNRLNNDNIICSDKHRSISSFVKSLGLEHKKVKSSDKQYVTEGIYHVQKVNSLTSGFRRWVKGNFVSVSTKYLQNYLFWYQMNEVIKESENKTEDFLKFSLVDSETFDRNKQIEEKYQEILEY